MSINYDELNKSRKFAENLVNNVYSPKTNWEKTAKNLLIIEIYKCGGQVNLIIKSLC